MRKIVLIIALFITFAETGHAWVYPEHRSITMLAIQKLNPGYRAEIERLWASARKGFELRLTDSVVDAGQSLKPDRLDYASWSAIGGDHSTSPENMLHNILQTDWILEVANIAAILKTGIENAKTKSALSNKVRDSDIRLLRADPEYVTRAGANNGHFMMARPDVGTSAATYFEACFREGCLMNIIGSYKWFHASALVKASKLTSGGLTQKQRSALTLSALADEVFALHFLEDGFASGHVAGVWGDASQRKGTHDYYNEMGLEVTTWNGDRMVLMGDAYMRQEDAERAADAVRLSLEQLLDAANLMGASLTANIGPGMLSPDTLNVGKAIYMPASHVDTAYEKLFHAVLVHTAVPGLASGLGELPRFRSEIGPFIGISPAARASLIGSGFGNTQNTAGITPGLELGFRVGLGMEGVLNESGDGLIFLDLGWRLDAASSMKIYTDPGLKQFGSIFSAIPSRDAYYARIRLPFYLVPGDLLIVAPILFIFSPNTADKMLVTAGNGGLIPWQTGIVTPIGRFQFILGREIGICLYGSGNTRDAFLFPDNIVQDNQVLVEMYSTQIDFPILEYRPLRTFSSRQSASLVLQINAGLDIPGKVHVRYPVDAIAPTTRATWFVGLRLAFDWRYYFSKSH